MGSVKRECQKARVPRVLGVVGTLAFCHNVLFAKDLKSENERECQGAATYTPHPRAVRLGVRRLSPFAQLIDFYFKIPNPLGYPPANHGRFPDCPTTP